jgi:hypothetical protein
MNEASDTPTTDGQYRRDIEPALNELAGLAGVAALLFDALHENSERATSDSAQQAFGWLDTRLSAAAEHALAIHERRATRWNTLMEADDIREALKRAEADGERIQAEMARGGVPS